MKTSTKKFIKAVFALTTFTIIGFLISSIVVLWLLTIKAPMWLINNSVFFITALGLIIGMIAMYRIVVTEYLPQYRKETIEHEAKQTNNS